MEEYSGDLKQLEDRVGKVRSKLSTNSEEWKPRIQAMTELIELINEGNVKIPNFAKAFGNSLWVLAE